MNARIGIKLVGAVAFCVALCTVALAPIGARAQQVDPNANKPISLNFEQAPIQNVLKAIFSSVGANYSVDPDVQGNVNIQMNNVGFDAALQSLLSSMNPPLTYDYDPASNTYHVRVRQVGGSGSSPRADDRDHDYGRLGPGDELDPDPGCPDGCRHAGEYSEAVRVQECGHCGSGDAASGPQRRRRLDEYQ